MGIVVQGRRQIYELNRYVHHLVLSYLKSQELVA
jgi:hypothetical protein